MKKKLSSFIALTMLMSVVHLPVRAEKYGNYPEHRPISSYEYQWGIASAQSPSANRFSITDEYGTRYFILLDKDLEGNYLVLADELYGSTRFHELYGANDINSGNILRSVWDFDESDENSIAHFLNHEFLTDNYSGTKLPESVKSNLLEKTWRVELNDVGGVANITGLSESEQIKYDTWINDSLNPDLTMKVSILSVSEFNAYKDKIGGIGTSWDKGAIMRTVYSTVSLNSDGTVEYTNYNFKLDKSNDNTGVISISDSNYDANIQLRPVFWLDKDFFKNSRINVNESGENPVAEIKQYTFDDLSDKYTDEELTALGIELGERDTEVSIYPVHKVITRPPEYQIETDLIPGKSPNENLFSVPDANGFMRRFILLDTDSNGNYFVMADESYGTHSFTTLSENQVENKDAKDSEWSFNPENENSVAYWLNDDKNGFLATGNGGLTLPDKIIDNLVLKEWQIENNYVENTVPETHENYADVEKWLKNKENLRSVTSKLSLLSLTEYNAYKDKISACILSDTWAGDMLRTVWSQASVNDESITFNVNPLHILPNADLTKTWCMNNVDLKYATGDSGVYGIRPVFWLDKDFFREVKLDVLKSGDNVKKKMKKNGFADLSEIYSEVELEEIGFELQVIPGARNVVAAGIKAVGAVTEIFYEFISPVAAKERKSIFEAYIENDDGYLPVFKDIKSNLVLGDFLGKHMKIAVIPKDEDKSDGKRVYSNVFKVDTADIFVTCCDVSKEDGISADVTLRNNTDEAIPVAVSVVCYNASNQIKYIETRTEDVNGETVIRAGIDNISIGDGDYVEITAKVNGSSIYLKRVK